MPEGKDQKRIIGLYGEMNLAMELHQRGWQVYSAYIDEQVDFVIAKYYCMHCNKFTDLFIRRIEWEGKERKATTNLCNRCEQNKLKIIERFLQVKTSEGKEKQNSDIRDYSFHANLKYHVDDRTFYIWIAVVENKKYYKVPFYYIFHTSEVNKFDNINLPSYQIIDNQKLTFKIDSEGIVHNRGRNIEEKDKYQCFNDDFFNNFDKLSAIRPSDIMG